MKHFERRKRVHVRFAFSPLRRAKQLNVRLAGELGVYAPLHAHLGGASIPRLGDAPAHLLVGQQVRRAAKRDAETRRAGAEARRRRSESVGGFAGDGDDGFGTDAEGGFETSDDESDGTPRRHAADDQDSGGFAEFADDQEGGLHSYRALVTGRIGRDDA